MKMPILLITSKTMKRWLFAMLHPDAITLNTITYIHNKGSFKYKNQMLVSFIHQLIKLLKLVLYNREFSRPYKKKGPFPGPFTHFIKRKFISYNRI